MQLQRHIKAHEKRHRPHKHQALTFTKLLRHERDQPRHDGRVLHATDANGRRHPDLLEDVETPGFRRVSIHNLQRSAVRVNK